jgi:hypothetical protein
VIVRSIDADFHLSPPRPLNFGGLLRSGGGDVGLFRTGDRRRDYDNGSVVGFQEFIPEAPSNLPQALTFGGDVRVTGGTGDFFVVPFAEFDFYSHSFSQSFSSRSVDVSDSDVGVGPYLELSRRVVDKPWLIVDAFVGWSYVETSHSSGDHTLATQTLYDTLHTYNYSGLAFNSQFQSPIPGLTGAVILDTEALQAVGFPASGFHNPRQSDRTSILAKFYAVTGADLDVRLNEIPIGLKVGRKFGRLTLLAELGGSVNVIDYDLDSTTTWYRSTGGVHSRKRWSDSGSPVKAGVFGGLAAQCDLTQDGRFFLEAHGTYRWVDEVHASAGPVSTKIDVSSWEGGLSIGVRL